MEKDVDNILKLHENNNKIVPIERNGTLNLDRYHTYDKIVSWMFKMRNDHGKHVKIFKIGESWEHRPLFTMKINKNSQNDRKAIWLDAGIHANEWIGPAVMLYFIQDVKNFTLFFIYLLKKNIFFHLFLFLVNQVTKLL